MISTKRLLRRGVSCKLEVQVDGHTFKNVEAVSIGLMNFKYMYKGFSNWSPAALVNDGLVEFVSRPKASLKSIDDLIHSVKLSCNGGIHSYFNEKQTILRGSKFKFSNRNYDSEGYLVEQPLTIDGENYILKKTLEVEVLKEELEVIVDLDRVFEEGYKERRDRSMALPAPP